MRSSKLNVVVGRFGKFLVMALLVLPFFPVVGLPGCATTSGPLFKESPVPEGKAVLYFYRQSAFMAAAVKHELYVNAEYLAEITNGGYVSYVADPGDVNIVSTQTLSDLWPTFGWMGEGRKVAESHGDLGLGIIKVRAGAVYYFKYKRKWGTGLVIEQVPEEIGKQEIQGLNLFPAPPDSQDHQTSGRGGDAPQ